MVLRRSTRSVLTDEPTATPARTIKVEGVLTEKRGSGINWPKVISTLIGIASAVLAAKSPKSRERAVQLGKKVQQHPKVQQGVQKVAGNPKIQAGAEAVTAVCGPRVEQARTAYSERFPNGLRRRGPGFPASPAATTPGVPSVDLGTSPAGTTTATPTASPTVSDRS